MALNLPDEVISDPAARRLARVEGINISSHAQLVRQQQHFSAPNLAALRQLSALGIG